MPISKDIRAYNAAQSTGDKRICDALAKAIDRSLPGAEKKVWHRHPVWFLDGNPIVGYSKLKDCIRLLFWSGRSFDEPSLSPEGTFKAAEARYTDATEISPKDLTRWLKKSIEIQWDYKNIVKRKGRLERLKAADWRHEMLARIRVLIKQAVPNVVEEVKWRKPSNPAGVPVWSIAPADGRTGGGGIVCTGETYKDAVKLTFAKGASLPDPSSLFNAGLDGHTRRAIDIHALAKVDAEWEAAFKALVKAAAAENGPPPPAKKTKTSASKAKVLKLLSGGNPQIAKADGDAPVQAYIAAMSGGGPGWKRDIGKRLDTLMARTVPEARKAVKWNSPFYGVEGQGWFVSFHVFTRYVKVTFFRGTSLRPIPPGGTGKDARWIDIHEGDTFNEEQMKSWVKQAAALPGWVP